ncbi:uncharacterized protein [Watersipora subatra]|uniref:uncharacterized protein n=1 Tax=Watersipora subatra TaxID=2589382 RepID=UPI00355B192D
MAAYRWVNTGKMDKIIGRLQKKTVAYKASNAWFDNQQINVDYIQKHDPNALQSVRKRSRSESLEKINRRVSRPTTASHASRHDFDAQDCHIDYLKKTLPYNYPVEARSVSSSDDLQSIGEKLSRETSASKAARHDFDAQREHVKYLEKTDPKYPGHKKYGFRRKTAPFIHITDETEVTALGEKLSKETTASKAARHDFDNQREHLIVIAIAEKYGFRKKAAPFVTVTSESEVIALGEKLSKETAASKAARYDFDAQKEHVKYIENNDPNYPGNKKYGFRRRMAPFRAISNTEELGELNQRLTKPTVASEGGKSLQNKEYLYVPPVYTSAFPEVKNGDTKYKGTLKISSAKLQESVERLSRLPKRYQ